MTRNRLVAYAEDLRARHNDPPSCRSVRLFVLIDALGWNTLNDHPGLFGRLPHRTPLRTVLGFSSGAIPTILTGLPPSRTGHWNLLYYDPRQSPFRWLRHLGFLPERVLDNRIGRRLIRELGRRFLGLGPLFECCVSPRLLPWFNWVEKRNIYDRGGIAGAPSIFDMLAADRVPSFLYSYHHWTDEQILEKALQDLRCGRRGFFFLYLSEFDHFLHASRNDPVRIADRLRWYESRLSSIFDTALTADPGAVVTVFSDHGMAPVRRTYDLVAEIDALGLSMPRDYLAVYDSTMARFWFFSERARRDIMACLNRCEFGHILSEQELRELGVFFDDHRFGDLVFLLDAGCLLSRSDFNGPRWRPAGMHGYHPNDVDSDAVFLSSAEPPIPMHAISDVYDCMHEAALALAEECA